MRRFSIAVLLLAACATQPPRPPAPPTSARVEPQPQPARSPNALTPVGSVPRTITEPKIRVGLLTDQVSVTFPRTTDGYYVIGDAGPSTLKRGFTLAPPLAKATSSSGNV